LLSAVAMSAFISLFLEYKKENILKKNKDALSFLISAIISFIYYIALKNTADAGVKDMLYLGFYGIIPSLILIGIYLIYSAENEDTLFAHIFKSFMLGFFVSLIIYIGLTLCYTAFDILVLSLNIHFYATIAVFSFVFVFVNLFLSFIPKKGEVKKLPKTYTNIIKNVMFPIYVLLLVILYLYIAKIIITGNIPIGEMNLYASLALLGFVFLYLNLKKENTKAVILFKKYGGFILIPVIITQLVFIGIRINAYGLTPLRCLSLAMILIGVMFLISSLTKMNIKYPFLIGGIILLIVTISPLNIYSVSNKTQEARLISVMEKYDIYNSQGSKSLKDKNISEADKKTIESCHNFLVTSPGIKSDFVKNIKDKKDTEYLYGFKFDTEEDLSDFDDYENYYYTYNFQDKKIDIKDYKSIYQINTQSKITKEKFKDEKKLKNYFMKVYEQNGKKSNDDTVLVYTPDKDTKIIFDYINITLENSTITSYDYSGLMLCK
ncbi:DUF4153 domain-containing protein, partial [Anaerofustis sp.]|uniref:DUF4153 domain-containing protein n=1 Tax=Anaerofustis sp. TaxID=1872517 RepID=UPI0025C53C7C